MSCSRCANNSSNEGCLFKQCLKSEDARCLRPDLYRSHAIKFKITENGLLPPLGSIGGVGEIAAKAISACSDVNNPFISWEDLKQRAGVGQNVLEALANAGVLKDLPESNQISLF